MGRQMKDKSFLLVDDNKNNLKAMGRIFKALGCKKIHSADSADKAWFTLRCEQVDCIISSYDMKEMSGLALLKIVRGENALAEVPFFLTDPSFTKVKVAKAGQRGVTGLFVQPLDLKIIGKKIAASLGSTLEPVIQKATATVEQGKSLIDEKKYEEALELFYALINQKENPECYFNIGFIKTAQGKHGEAIEAFRKATQLDRCFAGAYKEMGRAYQALDKPKIAEECLQQAVDIYMGKDKIEAAEEILNELLESGSDSLNVFNTLGVIYRKKGKPESALKFYKKALRIHPDEPFIHYNIGRLHLDMGNSPDARHYFQNAVDRDQEFEEAKQIIKAIDLGLV